LSQSHRGRHFYGFLAKADSLYPSDKEIALDE
jgi:hypothetical protein